MVCFSWFDFLLKKNVVSATKENIVKIWSQIGVEKDRFWKKHGIYFLSIKAKKKQ